MEVSISKEVVEKLGREKFKPFEVTEDSFRWKSSFDIDLSKLTRLKAKELKNTLSPVVGLRGVKSALSDIDQWLEILDGEKVKCRALSKFDSMLKQYLKTAPKHWLYGKGQAGGHQPYFVSDISYVPPKTDSYGYRHPGYVRVLLRYEELGDFESAYLTFYKEDVVGKTVGVALAEAGYVLESPALLEEYERNCDKYRAIWDKIGLQCTAIGVGEKEETERHWYHRESREVQLDKHGEPARVVVDVLSEKDEKEGKQSKRPSNDFWAREGCDFEGKEGDDDRDLKPGDEDDADPALEAQADIPLLPSLKCFDLRRHTRLKIHVDQLTVYEYDTALGQKLILPSEVRGLVDTMVSHRSSFKDIVAGKTGGSIILCAGPPGTGKTLTSEVYSEAMSRPLYSVQCSQLGTNPEELEKELAIVFARAARWNAILLLDEADVYVAARGSDLTQNAIVGVFLRVLEYYSGTLFMTTNRADLVDDAVASRCLARIDYKIPSAQDQMKIWRTLADSSEISLSDEEIKKITAKHPSLSGRDIKNLLKLASMVSGASGKPVDEAVVSFVKQFKPTGG